MRWTWLVILLGAAAARAAESGGDAAELRGAVERGTAFLATDAMAWKEEHGCASCHHAALVAWSLREARGEGYAVSGPVLDEMTRWIAESGDGRTGIPRPEGIPKAYNAKPIWFALALESNPDPDDTQRRGLERLLATVIDDQTESGGWSSWPETRPPIFAPSDEVVTLQAALALLPSAQRGDRAALAAKEKALAWLAQSPAGDEPQALALRLVLYAREAEGGDAVGPLVERLRAAQRPEGGWSQTPDMPADAWATGQSIYALIEAGIPTDDPAITRGRAFLILTQREDGSWPMASRPAKPGGGPSKSLIPITAAGTAWAVLGLVHRPMDQGKAAPG